MPASEKVKRQWRERKRRQRERELRADGATVTTADMRILAIDIETRPNLAYVWGTWKENVHPDQIVDAVEVICFAAKWIGVPATEFRSDHHHGHKEVVQRAWELLNEADAVLHWHGQGFDIPHLNREFLLAGMNPPSPYRQIDLYQTAKKRFRFASNRLAHVSEVLGLEGKVEHEGFKLWLKCMEGDDSAWKKMREYNIHDTELLEGIYVHLRPWVVGHPSHSALTAKDVCPTCGADALLRDGDVALTTARYARFQCESCGAWSRSTKRIDGAHVTPVAQQ